MKSNNEEVRKQRRLEKLGTNNPVCVVCGEDDYRCLEQHHIAGQKYADELCNVCRNCHRKLSDKQIDHPKNIDKQPSPQEMMGHWLIGLADFFELLVEKLREFAHFLIESVQTREV